MGILYRAGWLEASVTGRRTRGRGYGGKKLVKEFHHVNRIVLLGYELRAWVRPPCPSRRKHGVKLEGDMERSRV
jgi:hypothetical protein